MELGFPYMSPGSLKLAIILFNVQQHLLKMIIYPFYLISNSNEPHYICVEMTPKRASYGYQYLSHWCRSTDVEVLSLGKNPWVWYDRSPCYENPVHIEIGELASQWHHSSRYSTRLDISSLPLCQRDMVSTFGHEIGWGKRKKKLFQDNFITSILFQKIISTHVHFMNIRK